MIKKKIKIIRKIYIFYLVMFFIFMLFNFVYATNNTEENENENSESLIKVQEKFGFFDYTNQINEYIEKSESSQIINFNNLTSDLLKTNNIKYDNLIQKILGLVFSEVIISLKSGASIYIIIVLMTMLSKMELSKDRMTSNIAFFACYLVIISLCIKTYIKLIASFKNTITIISTLMQIISPFVLTTLIASGGITSVGIIQPLMLFLASFIGLVVNSVIIPLITLSVAFNVVNSITDKMSFDKISISFSKLALWTIGTLLTIFLSVLALETTITTSIDSLTVKTTQSIVSNFVPVVGKFFSDSFETVVGATKIVGKVGGVLGIISIVIVSIIPVIKIIAGMFVYSALGIFSELIGADSKIIKTMDMFKDTYKNMLGILIGIIILFVISIGIVINVSTYIVK